MAVQETPEVEAGRRRGSIWIWVVGAVALIAIGWVVFDLVTEPAVPAGVEEAIDDYIAAWEDRDAEAIRAVTGDGTAHFILNEFIYDTDWNPDAPEQVRYAHVDDADVESIISGSFPSKQWMVERGTGVVVTGDGPWFVSFPEAWIEDFETEQERLEGIALYVVVEQDGEFKVANHMWSGLATTVYE